MYPIQQYVSHQEYVNENGERFILPLAFVGGLAAGSLVRPRPYYYGNPYYGNPYYSYPYYSGYGYGTYPYYYRNEQ